MTTESAATPSMTSGAGEGGQASANFDPSRMAAIIADEVAENCRYRRGSDNRERVRQGAYKGALLAFNLIEGIDAIATETRRAETTGSVEDEGAGPEGIAHEND